MGTMRAARRRPSFFVSCMFRFVESQSPSRDVSRRRARLDCSVPRIGPETPFLLDDAAVLPPNGAANPASLFAGAVVDRNQLRCAAETQTVRGLTVYTLLQHTVA